MHIEISHSGLICLEMAGLSPLGKVFMLLLALLVAGMAQAETWRIEDVSMSDRQQVLPAAHLPGPQSQFAARPRRRRSGS